MRQAAVTPKSIWRAVIVPTVALLLSLGSSVAGSLYTGTGASDLTIELEGASSSASGFLADTSKLIPLGYAFGAGMVSAVNPCGFVMLPAYLGLYLGARSETSTSPKRLGRALVVGLTVTSSFVVLFATVGLLIGGGLGSLAELFPWIGLVIGVALAIAGAWMLGGGILYTSLGERAAAYTGHSTQPGIRSYFLFGLGYGTASLSCTLPVFLTVVGSSIAVTRLSSSIGQFILYAFGVGVVILALTLSAAFFKTALVGALRRVLPYTQSASALLMLAAGAYIVYYWLTLGELLDTFL